MQGIQIGSHGATTPQSQAQQDSLFVVNSILLKKYNDLNALVTGATKITSEMFDGGLGVWISRTQAISCSLMMGHRFFL